MSSDASKMKFDPIPVLPPGIAPPTAETKPSATAPAPAPKPNPPTPKAPEKTAESKPVSATTPSTPSSGNLTPEWLSGLFMPSKNTGVIVIAACSLLAGWYGVRTLFPPAAHSPDAAEKKSVAELPKAHDDKPNPPKDHVANGDLPPTPDKPTVTTPTITSPYVSPSEIKVDPIAPPIIIGPAATTSGTTPLIPAATTETGKTPILPAVDLPKIVPIAIDSNPSNTGVKTVGHSEPAPGQAPAIAIPTATESKPPVLEIPAATSGAGSNSGSNQVPVIVPASGTGGAGGPPVIPNPVITLPNATDNKNEKKDKPAAPATPVTVPTLPGLDVPPVTGTGTPVPIPSKPAEHPRNETGIGTLPTIPTTTTPTTAAPTLPSATTTTPSAVGGTSMVVPPGLSTTPTSVPPVATTPKTDVALPKIESNLIPPATTPSSSTPTITPAITPTMTPTVTPSAATPVSRTDPKLLPVNNSSTDVKTDFDVDLHYPKANETYASISKLHYGDERYANVLAQFNQSANRGNGNVVQIPPTWWVKKQMGAPVSAPGSSPSSVSVPDDKWTPAAAASSNTYRFYTVPTGGMTFKQIARQAYGTEDDWQRVFNLNSRFSSDAVIPENTRIRLTADAKIGQ